MLIVFADEEWADAMTQELAENLIARVKTEGTPLIDDGGATFVWLAPQPDIAPASMPYLAGDFNHWDHANGLTLEPIAPGVWARSIPLARDSYVEYAYFTSTRDEDRLVDPYNTRRVWNGISGYNHAFTMPDTPPTPHPLMTRQRGEGAVLPCVTRHLVSAFLYTWNREKGRRVYLYHPPTDDPVPLLLVYDGPDYIRRGRLINLVHNLILARQIRPIAMLLVANGRGARFLEYMTSDVTLGFVERELLPLAAQHLRLLPPEAEAGQHSGAGAYAVMGASMGGLMALYTGLRMPHLFGRVITQSGAFGLPLSARQLIYPLVEYPPPPAIRIWQDVGTLEFLLNANRDMHALLQARRYDLHYREYAGGHNYTTWGTSAADALLWLFGQ